MTDLLTRIRGKCIEANPDIARGLTPDTVTMTLKSRGDGRGRCRGTMLRGRPIRLADVLLAIKASPKCDTYWEYEATSDLIWDDAQIPRCWNLREDDLEKQTPETQEFVGKLLEE